MTHRAEHEDHLRWAYLDGEMSASEAAAFADDLSTQENHRMLEEVSFEAAVAERLAEPVPCPSEAWRLALARINAASHTSNKPDNSFGRRLLRYPMVLAAAAAAACLLVVGGTVILLAGVSDSPAFLAMTDPDMDTFASHTQVSDGAPGVRAFLGQHAPKLAFDPSNTLGQGAARYRLLGAREDSFGKETVVQLLFDCDGEPAKVIIAQKSGGAAQEIGRAVARGSIRASYPIGDVLVAVVGTEGAGALLGIVAPPTPESAALSEDPPTPETEGPCPKGEKAPELTDVVPEASGTAPNAPTSPANPALPAPSTPDNSDSSATTATPESPQEKAEPAETSNDSGLTLI